MTKVALAFSGFIAGLLFPGEAFAKTFTDYFKPTPIVCPATTNTWGDKSLLPRDTCNGLEDTTGTPTVKPKWMYWDGKILRAGDGKYHMFADRWPHESGMGDWVNSDTIHAVSSALLGPYVDQGYAFNNGPDGKDRHKGHNVTASELPDGTYCLVIDEIVPFTIFTAGSLDGPWTNRGHAQIDTNGVPINIPQPGDQHLESNISFVVRPDGNYEIIQRHGIIAVSTTGLLGPYKVQQPTTTYASGQTPPSNLATIYPNRPKHLSSLAPQTPESVYVYAEDPIIWYSGGQYHVIYNYPDDRVAYHLTSPDGIHGWTDQGLAFDPRDSQKLFTNSDGSVGHWYNVERPNVIMEDGHVAYFTFAVSDVFKMGISGSSNDATKVVVVSFDGVTFDQETGIGGADGGTPATGDAGGRAAPDGGGGSGGRDIAASGAGGSSGGVDAAINPLPGTGGSIAIGGTSGGAEAGGRGGRGGLGGAGGSIGSGGAGGGQGYGGSSSSNRGGASGYGGTSISSSTKPAGSGGVGGSGGSIGGSHGGAGDSGRGCSCMLGGHRGQRKESRLEGIAAALFTLALSLRHRRRPTNMQEVPMSTRTTAMRTRPVTARCFALAALGVTYFLTGCNNTALPGKTDAGKSGGQDAAGKDVPTSDTVSGTGGSSGTGGTGAGGKSGTGGNTSQFAKACTEAGGLCVAVAPGSCSAGTVSSLSCGSGIGSICCMAGGSGGTGSSSGRGGNSGSGGKSGTGGGSGTGGNTSVPINTCTEAGGTCVGVLPGSCASGTMNLSLSCGSGVGAACCMPGGAGGRGGNSGTAGQSAGGANGQGGTGGGRTEPQAVACEKAGGICTEQGTCAKQGGTVTAESPAGCRFSDAPGECCVTPAPQPNPSTCAEAGGTCTSIAGCLMAGGYFTATNYDCASPGSCCVPNATCGTATIECCGDAVIYNAACQRGQFVCVVGSPMPRGTCLSM
jgi:hypothetical protein